MSDPAGPVFNPGGGDAELTMPTDAIAEDGDLSLYPGGFSILPFSASANWDSWGAAGFAFTVRSGSHGLQTLSWNAGESFGWRVYFLGDWSEFLYSVSSMEANNLYYTKDYIDALEARIEALEA
jgi:hypothetical protein